MNERQLEEGNKIQKKINQSKRDLTLLSKLDDYEVTIQTASSVSYPRNDNAVSMSDYGKNFVKEVVEKAIKLIEEQQKILFDNLGKL